MGFIRGGGGGGAYIWKEFCISKRATSHLRVRLKAMCATFDEDFSHLYK